MEWQEWIGRKVFIKLIDGTVFTFSNIVSFDDPFLTITDKYGKQVSINVNNISRMREEGGE